MLTCLFCVLFVFFNDQNYKNYDRLELSIILLIQKIIPTITGLKDQNGQFLNITASLLKLDFWTNMWLTTYK